MIDCDCCRVSELHLLAILRSIRYLLVQNGQLPIAATTEWPPCLMSRTYTTLDILWWIRSRSQVTRITEIRGQKKRLAASAHVQLPSPTTNHQPAVIQREILRRDTSTTTSQHITFMMQEQCDHDREHSTNAYDEQSSSSLHRVAIHGREEGQSSTD